MAGAFIDADGVIKIHFNFIINIRLAQPQVYQAYIGDHFQVIADRKENAIDLQKTFSDCMMHAPSGPGSKYGS